MCYIGKTVSQKGHCEGNTGNYLFNLALESYISKEEADVSFYSLWDFEKHSAEFVNNNFDMVLYSTANIINPKANLITSKDFSTNTIYLAKLAKE